MPYLKMSAIRFAAERLGMSLSHQYADEKGLFLSDIYRSKELEGESFEFWYMKGVDGTVLIPSTPRKKTACRQIMEYLSGVTVVCHGDVDGLIAAAVAIRHYGGSLDRLVITQPFFLDKIQVDGPVVVVDIAVNKRDAAMTSTFAATHDVVAWCDHHQGGEPLAEVLGERVHLGDTPSCPALMAAVGMEVPAEWVAAANAADAPADFPPTALSILLTRAQKVALVEQNESGQKGRMDNVQRAIVALLVNGHDPDGLVADSASRYEALETATKTAADGLTIVAQCGDLVVAETTLQDGALVDKTQLFMLGYKQAKVVCLYYHAQDGREVTTVATADKGINLVERFGLASGAAFRVTLVEGDWEAQRRQVLCALIGRECQCGSGLPWQICPAANPCCG